MADIVEDVIVLDRLPERLGIPCRRLNTVHLCNESPHNPKKSENQYIVQHTTVSNTLKNRSIQKEVKFMRNTLFPFTFGQSSAPSSQPSHHSRQQQKEQSQNNRSQKPLQHRPKFRVPIQFSSKCRP